MFILPSTGSLLLVLCISNFVPTGRGTLLHDMCRVSSKGGGWVDTCEASPLDGSIFPQLLNFPSLQNITLYNPKCSSSPPKTLNNYSPHYTKVLFISPPHSTSSPRRISNPCVYSECRGTLLSMCVYTCIQRNFCTQ